MVRQAAADLLARAPVRPLAPAVVLPLPGRTRVVELEDWPDRDQDREEVLRRFADDEMRSVNAPAWGFLAEATLDGEPPQDVVVAVYSARGLHPRITVAALDADGELSAFTAAEELAPSAMPFLAPLQRAVDASRAPDVFDASTS